MTGVIYNVMNYDTTSPPTVMGFSIGSAA